MKKLNQKGFGHLYILIVVAVLVIVGGAGWFVYNSSHKNTATTTTNPSPTPVVAQNDKRKILAPQTTPPVVDECEMPLETLQDGNTSPIGCPDTGVNIKAWDALKASGKNVMSLPVKSTIDEVVQAMCKDIKNSTGPITESAENIVDNYNSWNYINDPKITGFMANIDTVCN